MIGKQLKKVINESEVSVKEIADKLDLTPQSLYKMFKKESVESKYLEKIADILNLPMSVFFPGEKPVANVYAPKNYSQNRPGFLYLEEFFLKQEALRDRYEMRDLPVRRLLFLKHSVLDILVVEQLFDALEEIETLIASKDEESKKRYIEDYFSHRIVPKIRKSTFNSIVEHRLIEDDLITDYLSNFVSEY